MEREKNPEKVPPISSKRWKSMIYKNKEVLAVSLGNGISEVLTKANNLGLEAVSMHIIFTRVSVANNRPFYRIYLLDKKLYNGNTDCWVYWEMPVLITCFEQTFPMGLDPYAQGYKPKEEIMEEKRRRSAEQLQAIMGEMITGIFRLAAERVPQEVGIPVYFGEFMEKQQRVFPLSH